MKILILGGSGLIGSAIAKHLSGDHAVYVFDLIAPEYGTHVSTTEGDYDVVIDCARYTNIKNQIQALKLMNAGKLILFSSIYGHKAPDFSIYPGTEVPETPLEYAIWKGGVENATRYLAQKLKPHQIQVNCIAPGGIINHHSDIFQEEYRTAYNVGMIETKAILPVIDMLLHPDNKVNGQVICVDGGIL